jgi:hypothetical protein
MIKFFRNIRQKLLTENKTGRYFKYAIGEIILVVIGILIALSINNWNEQQKDNQLERKMLTEFLSDNEADILESKNALNLLKKAQLSSNYILKTLKENKEYKDSMDIHFAMALRLWSLSPNTTAFESAKTIGFNLIKNDSIRINESKINTYVFDYVKVLESRWQDYNTSIVLPYILPFFDYYNYSKMKPTDFQSLKTDIIYQGIIQSLEVMRMRYMETLTIRLDLLTELNMQLKQELYD